VTWSPTSSFRTSTWRCGAGGTSIASGILQLGNGGTTCFWDIATFCLIERRSQHLSFGEFSSKFAAAAKAAPHLDDPQVIESPPGTHPEPVAVDDVQQDPSVNAREVLPGIHAVLAVPLLREDKVIGGLVIRRRSEDGFAPTLVTLMQTFAGQAVLAIEAPPGGVAVGLRTLAAGDWIPGELMESERAERRYRELTGFGPAAPRLRDAVTNHCPVPDVRRTVTSPIA